MEHIYPSISTKGEIRLIWWDSVLSLSNTRYSTILPGDMCGLRSPITRAGEHLNGQLTEVKLTSFTLRQQGLYRCSHTQDITGDQALLFMEDRGEFWMIDTDLHVFVLLMRKYVYSLTLICLLGNSFHMYLIGKMQKKFFFKLQFGIILF